MRLVICRQLDLSTEQIPNANYTVNRVGALDSVAGEFCIGQHCPPEKLI